MVISEVGGNGKHETHVTAQQLLPHLNSDATERSLEHLRPEECEEGDIRSFVCDTCSFSDLFELDLHHTIILVTLRVQTGEDIQTLIPTLLRGKPTWRFREETQGKSQDQTWYCLDAPCDSEGGGASDSLDW